LQHKQYFGVLDVETIIEFQTSYKVTILVWNYLVVTVILQNTKSHFIILVLENLI